jgi:hypothetical protein
MNKRASGSRTSYELFGCARPLDCLAKWQCFFVPEIAATLTAGSDRWTNPALPRVRSPNSVLCSVGRPVRAHEPIPGRRFPAVLGQHRGAKVAIKREEICKI